MIIFYFRYQASRIYYILNRLRRTNSIKYLLLMPDRPKSLLGVHHHQCRGWQVRCRRDIARLILVSPVNPRGKARARERATLAQNKKAPLRSFSCSGGGASPRRKMLCGSSIPLSCSSNPLPASSRATQVYSGGGSCSARTAQG